MCPHGAAMSGVKRQGCLCDRLSNPPGGGKSRWIVHTVRGDSGVASEGGCERASGVDSEGDVNNFNNHRSNV